jgi:maltooligosyltrehalose synthase
MISQRRLAPLGGINSLSQTMLKLASPGVPDFYQGSELWDLSMVDPDNRRPVDFALRARRLEEAASRPVSCANGRRRRQAATDPCGAAVPAPPRAALRRRWVHP